MERKISDLYNMLPFELTTGQKNALSMIETGKHTLIHGLSGTGKSAILQILKDFYGGSIIFCGSTGVSNAGLFNFKGGVGTAHRVFSLGLTTATPKDYKDVSKYTNTIFGSSSQITKVVIDEAFMLNSDHLNLIQHRIKRFNKGTKKRKPRNIQLILCGDSSQLSPILKDDQVKDYTERYGHQLLFLSDTFKKMDFQIAPLTEVMRQKDPTFKAALEVIRYKEEHRFDRMVEWLNKRVLPAPDNALVLAPTNKQVDYYNQIAFDNNPNECFCYTASIADKFNMKDCPVPEELYLKEGLQVIALTNHPEGLWVNGTAMTVVQCTADGVWCTLNRTGDQVFVEPYTFEEHEIYVEGKTISEDGSSVDVLGTRLRGSCTQICLKPASALSCHRAQGMTADYPVLVDMGSDYPFKHTPFGCGLLYVIISRVTKIEYLYLKKPLTKNFIKVCEDTLKWVISLEKTQ